MDRDRFEDWLRSYGAAWENGDPARAVDLFEPDAEYFETPFDAPLSGHAEIARYWQEGAVEGQRNVAFSFAVISFSRSRGVAQWHASFTRTSSGKHVELDGILAAQFAASGKCRVFREWWHRKET